MNRPSRHRAALGVLVVLTLVVVRGGFLLARSDGLSDDPDAYRVIAETLATTGVYGLPVEVVDGAPAARATAFRPPLYPWLLSWMVDREGTLANRPVAVFHWLLGIVTIVCTWDIARRFLSARAALLAAGLVMVDPILLWQSALVMTETIATALGVLVWWCWVVGVCRVPPRGSADEPQRRARALLPGSVGFGVLGLGGLLLIAILCRPTFLVWAALILAALLLVGSHRWSRRVSMIAVAAVVIAAGVGAWTLRNAIAVGHPVWGTTHGGYTLLLANNDSFYDYLEEKPWQLPWRQAAWDPSHFFAQYQALPRSGDEWEDDRIAYAAAKATISARPSMFWYSCGVRLMRLWQPFPHATVDRSTVSIVAVGLFHSLVYLLILVALLRHRGALVGQRWREWIPLWPGVALILTLSLIHAVYWSNPRMRSPATAVLAIAAAAALDRRSSPVN